MGATMSGSSSVALLLVAPVPEVPLVPHHREGQVGEELLVAQPHEVGGILAGVVADEDTIDSRAEVGRDPVEHLGKGRGGVVRHDEDADAHA
jgi:hypothetical protein